jgi:hypothetical protein
MKTEEFRLPAYWATCLLYGDTTGLEEAEAEEASAVGGDARPRPVHRRGR